MRLSGRILIALASVGAYMTRKRVVCTMALGVVAVLGSLMAVAVTAKSAAAGSTTPSRSLQGTPVAPIISVTAASVGSFAFSFHGVILQDVRLKGTRVHSSSCHWASGWNSGQGVDGRLYWFWDTHMWVCPNRNSPTGWAKAGGGMTGRNCGNPVKLKGRPHGPIVHNVTIVRSFAKLHIVVKARAAASVSGSCPGGGLSGSASASGMVSAIINEGMIVEAKGSSGSLKVLVRRALTAKGVAGAVANLHLTCSSATTTTVTTTPPPTTTTVTTTPTPPMFTMVFNTLNDIPAGTCSPEVLHVTSSAAGQVQVTPQVGLISTVDCYQPVTGQLTTVKIPVIASSQTQDLTVYVYEPSDTSATSDMLTAVPLIPGVDANSNTAVTTFTVSHPTRP